MSVTIGVPEALTEKVTEFVKAEGLSCEVVARGGTLEVVQAQEGEQSDSSTLHAGGWIACEDAFAAAAKLGIPRKAMGKLIDLLEIRIRGCQLGCF